LRLAGRAQRRFLGAFFPLRSKLGAVTRGVNVARSACVTTVSVTRVAPSLVVTVVVRVAPRAALQAEPRDASPEIHSASATESASRMASSRAVDVGVDRHGRRICPRPT
jgi:hypothetical protein